MSSPHIGEDHEIALELSRACAVPQSGKIASKVDEVKVIHLFWWLPVAGRC